MKRILLFSIIFLTSTLYAGETSQQQIDELKRRVARLEIMLQQLARQVAIQQPMISPQIIQQTPVTKKQYVVTLYDNSTFLIYSWDRVTKTSRGFKGTSTKKIYRMYDIFGKTREWSIDKVKSITSVGE